MRVRVRWTETAVYDVEIETDKLIAELEEEDRWFEIVDAQDPEWFRTGLVEISDRELESLELIREPSPEP